MIRRAFFIAVIFSVFTGVVQGQVRKPTKPFSVLTAEWSRILDGADQYLLSPTPSDTLTKTTRELITQVRQEVGAAREEANQLLAEQQNLLDALGPPPEDGAPPEAKEIADQRAQILEGIAFYKAQVAQADLTLARAEKLESTISAIGRQRLADRLLAVNALPWHPDVVGKAVPEAISLTRMLLTSPLTWYESLEPAAKSQITGYRLAFFVIVAALIGWLLQRELLRRFGRNPEIADPSYSRRVVAAVAETVARGIVPAAILAGFYFRATTPETPVSGLFANVLASVFSALLVLIFAIALVRAALPAGMPAWRLSDTKPENARRIRTLLTTLVVVFSFDTLASRSTSGMQISSELLIAGAFLATLLEGTILAVLTRSSLWQHDGTQSPAGQLSQEEPPQPEAKPEEPDPKRLMSFVRRLVAAVAISGVGASAAGYGELGRYLVINLVPTVLISGILYLLRGTLRELTGAFTRSELMRRNIDMSHRSRRVVKFWLRALLDLVLLVAAILLIAPLWGVPAEDLLQWTLLALSGLKVGGVTISLLDFVFALSLFAAALLATKMVKRGLSRHVLPETNLDPGLQHSLAAGVGYVGVILASFLAIAVLGINLTNIALVAGALSVGIGFGLQNVVNNFVSGIILLIERPVKVGDWVVIGDKEGTIKRINVRATELQTFQRASVIIPNAEFISAPVTNWTHKDTYGRIEVAVGVAYGSPVDRVMEILLETARAHERVVTYPEPFVLFQDFGASSLDFELRCYTSDVTWRLRIASDLRRAIEARFRDEAIEIPFPQRVLHVAPGNGEKITEVMTSTTAASSPPGGGGGDPDT